MGLTINIHSGKLTWLENGAQMKMYMDPIENQDIPYFPSSYVYQKVTTSKGNQRISQSMEAG